MREFVTLVCGFGRCGSSLTMQMLEAGGMPVTGDYPTFEDAHGAQPGNTAWFQRQIGGAVKVLDPQRVGLPKDIPCRVIWLDRRPEEQAKSQVKILRQLQHVGGLNRHAVRAFAASYGPDRVKALAAIRAAGFGLLQLSFEGLLAAPLPSAMTIAHFLGEPMMDWHRMARVVQPRSTACRPDMSLEISLLAEREASLMRSAQERKAG